MRSESGLGGLSGRAFEGKEKRLIQGASCCGVPCTQEAREGQMARCQQKRKLEGVPGPWR